MYKLVTIFFLFSVVAASAQDMPERGEVRKGNRQYNKGNYEKSIERYQRALELMPESFEAGYNLGNALYKAERFDTSEQTLQRAAADSLRSEEERAQAFHNLGNAQFKQEKYKEALESYKQSLRLNPSDMETKYNYAYTKRLLDDNKDGGGGDDQDKDKSQDQNKDQNKDQQNKDGDQQQDQQDSDPKQDQGDPDKEQQGKPQQSQTGISPQEQQQMLDAIQAQEDKTQEKLKERQGVVVRGQKNW